MFWPSSNVFQEHDAPSKYDEFPYKRLILFIFYRLLNLIVTYNHTGADRSATIIGYHRGISCQSLMNSCCYSVASTWFNICKFTSVIKLFHVCHLPGWRLWGTEATMAPAAYSCVEADELNDERRQELCVCVSIELFLPGGLNECIDYRPLSLLFAL